jgi:hypothetical protein
LNPNLSGLEKRIQKSWHAVKKIPWEIIGVMIQMMEVRFEIRKIPFFGTINPEKMINRIIYLKNSPNDPSFSKYSLG